MYNLGAQSHVKVSFEQPEYTGNVDALGTSRLLEAVWDVREASGKEIRFYQAGTSEMFGAAPAPQSERTAFYPRSPYAAAKVYAYWMTVNYREAYGHLRRQRDPLQPRVRAARRDVRDPQDHPCRDPHQTGDTGEAFFGNLDARRDWGHAEDYVETMWLMLQQEKPQDFVIATGETYSVREFVERGLHLSATWTGEKLRRDRPPLLASDRGRDLQGDATKAEGAWDGNRAWI